MAWVLIEEGPVRGSWLPRINVWRCRGCRSLASGPSGSDPGKCYVCADPGAYERGRRSSRR
jgi:hypothetical protein